MLVANISVEERTFISGSETATEPDGILKIEDGKTKGMTFAGLYNVDGKVSYYFHNETVKENAETRFVTEGTNTKPAKGDRTYGYYNAYKVSFEYKILNTDETIITGDDANAPYFAQILTKLGGYIPLTFAPTADGAWHTQTFTFTEEQSAVFSGLILKMGGLNGEMLVANIVVEPVAE